MGGLPCGRSPGSSQSSWESRLAVCWWSAGGLLESRGEQCYAPVMRSWQRQTLELELARWLSGRVRLKGMSIAAHEFHLLLQGVDSKKKYARRWLWSISQLLSSSLCRLLQVSLSCKGCSAVQFFALACAFQLWFHTRSVLLDFFCNKSS